MKRQPKINVTLHFPRFPGDPDTYLRIRRVGVIAIPDVNLFVINKTWALFTGLLLHICPNIQITRYEKTILAKYKISYH